MKGSNESKEIRTKVITKVIASIKATALQEKFTT